VFIPCSSQLTLQLRIVENTTVLRKTGCHGNKVASFLIIYIIRLFFSTLSPVTKRDSSVSPGMKYSRAVSRVTMAMWSNVSETVSASIIKIDATNPDDGGRGSLRNVGLQRHSHRLISREYSLAFSLRESFKSVQWLTTYWTIMIQSIAGAGISTFLGPT
jgi:hypothetical protein